MLDFTSDLILIVLAGFISLRFYRFRRNKRFTKLNGEQFIVRLLAFGLLSHFSYLVVYMLYQRTSYYGAWNFTQNDKSLVLLIFYSVSALMWGFILSENGTQEQWERGKSLFRIDGLMPDTTGIVEYELAQVILDNNLHEIYLLILKSRKVYVGFLMFADIDDEMPTEEKAIRIKPLKSGYRNLGKLAVNYNTIYLKKEDLDDEAKCIDAIMEIKDIVIFQRELVSLRRYCPNLNHQFGHD